MIPKIIHQIWIGPKKPPSYMKNWAKLNPSFQYILWDNERVSNFLIKNKKQYDLFGDKYHGKSDILRYEILHEYGGVYFDADCEPNRPLDDSLLDTDFFSCYLNEKKRNNRLANGIIGCVKGHKLMLEMIDHISKIQKIDQRPFELVGPIPFTEIYKKSSPGKIYPSHYFLPEFFDGEKYSGDFIPYTYHYWGTTKNLYENQDKNSDGYSIIITAYKTENFIEECLDSIQSQDFFKKNKNYEILLGIDNCEKTLKLVMRIIDKYDNIKVFFMLSNKGTYVTTNTLIKHSKYDKIVRFDSDDIMKTDMMTKINNFIGNWDVVRFGFCDFSENIKNCSKTNYLAHGAIAYKKDVFDTLGGYRDWLCSADSDFINRLKPDYKTYMLDEVIFYRRKHNNSLTSNNTTGIGTELRKKINSKLKVGFEYVNPVINDFLQITKETNIDNLIFDEKKEIKTLSIIIATYKNTKYIDECIDSVIESTKNQNVEILVGIDGCKETLEYVKQKSYPDNIKFYYFEKNVGPYIIKNSLSEIAIGENLIFFDSDDIMTQDMVSNSINSINHCDFIRHSYINFTDPNKLNENKRREFEGGIFTIKKEVFEYMNGFEPWKCEADSEFALRMSKSKYKTKLSNNLDFFRRIHNEGLTSRTDTGYRSKLRAEYRKLYHNKKTFGPLPKKVTEPFTEILVARSSVTPQPQKPVKEKNHNLLSKLISVMKIEVQPVQEEKTIDYDNVNETLRKRDIQKQEPKPINKNSNKGMSQNIKVSKNMNRPILSPKKLGGGSYRA
jgi:glycosyltransferase involved in cell wall biosynthesis